MFFKCKVCQEKDKRINDLLVEISYLRKLAGVEVPSTEGILASREADAILSASDSLIPIDENTEVANILTGMYDNSQVDVG